MPLLNYWRGLILKMPKDKRQAHADLQRSYFDLKINIFKLPIPEDVQARTHRIIEASAVSSGCRVLDVGTGIGVLVAHFLAAGVTPADIVGCDLSERMLAEARQRYPGVTFWQGDFLDFPSSAGPFDAVFFNACFGNFYDQDSVITKAVSLLDGGGRIVISHPMGARFVAQLNAHEPEIVPHLLPGHERLSKWCKQHDLTLSHWVDERDLYIARLDLRTGNGT